MKLWNSKWKRAKSTALIIDPNQTDQFYQNSIYETTKEKFPLKPVLEIQRESCTNKANHICSKSGKCDS